MDEVKRYGLRSFVSKKIGECSVACFSFSQDGATEIFTLPHHKIATIKRNVAILHSFQWPEMPTAKTIMVANDAVIFSEQPPELLQWSPDIPYKTTLKQHVDRLNSPIKETDYQKALCGFFSLKHVATCYDSNIVMVDGNPIEIKLEDGNVLFVVSDTDLRNILINDFECTSISDTTLLLTYSARIKTSSFEQFLLDHCDYFIPADGPACGICLTKYAKLITMRPCLHYGICAQCIDGLIRTSPPLMCPWCRNVVEQLQEPVWDMSHHN